MERKNNMFKVEKIFSRFPTTANLLLLFFTSALCFVICEISLRIATPDWLNYRLNILKNSGQMHYGSDSGSTAEFRNGLFYRFTPHSQFPITHPEYHNQAHIDEFGGRRVPSLGKITRTTVIPVYGDSFTFGIGVEDHETFISHLATGSNQPWLNLGVPGSAIHNHLDTLILRHSELGNPKKVIFAFFLGNDFADLINAYEKKSNNHHVDKTQKHGEKNDSILNKINTAFYHTFIVKNSYFLQFIKAKLVSLINKKTLTYANPVFKIMQNNPEYTQVAQSALFEQLDRLVKLKQQYHFKPLIIMIPDRYQLDEKARNYQAKLYGMPLQSLHPQRPNELLINALKHRSIDYIDASSCLAQYTSEKLYYLQDDHFTAQGQQRFAECVQQFIMSFNQDMT